MLLSNNNALTYFKNLTRSHEMMKSSRLQYAKPALRFRKETKWPKKKSSTHSIRDCYFTYLRSTYIGILVDILIFDVFSYNTV